MVNVLFAAALAAVTSTSGLPSNAPHSQASPAMFVVRDADTIIYVFGTFHALDSGADWFSGPVQGAFEHSNELVLETIIPDARTPLPLPAPLPTTSFAAAGSFLAGTRLAIDAGRAQGMKVANGADMVLRKVAKAEAKPVVGLETLDSQLAMLNRLIAGPQAGPVAARPAAAPDAAEMNDVSRAMAEMQAAWKRGDQTMFVTMLDQLSRSSPPTYKLMFKDRNARWADWISARLRTPGTVFVAVGAGHLAGRDSVLVRLAELGIRSARVN